jgi:circadian clock protein KaiB
MHSVQLTLYIAGQSTRSLTAIANLRRLGEQDLAGRYELTVVDVLEDPDAAEQARILTTPTLIKESPAPSRRVTGDLSDARKVLIGLALDPDTEAPPAEFRP